MSDLFFGTGGSSFFSVRSATIIVGSQVDEFFGLWSVFSRFSLVLFAVGSRTGVLVVLPFARHVF